MKKLILFIVVFCVLSRFAFAAEYNTTGKFVSTQDSGQGTVWSGTRFKFDTQVTLVSFTRMAISGATYPTQCGVFAGPTLLANGSYSGITCTLTTPYTINATGGNYGLLSNGNGNSYLCGYKSKTLPSREPIGNWTCNMYNNVCGGEQAIYIWSYFNYTIASSDVQSPLTSLISPANNTWNLSKSIVFIGKSTEETGTLANCSLFTNETSWSLKHTNTTCVSGVNCLIPETFTTDGIFLWNYKCCDNSGNCGFNATNYTLKIDSTVPSFSLNSTNSTNAGEYIRHNLQWADNFGLSGYIFQFYNNSFINQTGGFSSINSSPSGIWGNNTDFWITDSYADRVYHTNSVGVLIDSFSTSSFGSINPAGIWGNNSDFWILNGGSNIIYHTSKSGNYISNFSLENYGGWPPQILSIFGNNSDFWITDYFLDRVFHTNISGSLIESFSLNPPCSYSSGIWGNGTNFWITCGSKNIIYSFNKTFSLIESTNMSSFGMLSTYGIYGNNSDFWVVDSDNLYINHLRYNQIVVNDSWVQMSGATNWSNVTKLNSLPVGSIVNWRVYANDTAKNWNISNLYSYISTSASVTTTTCDPESLLTSNYIFQCSDNCVLTSNVEAQGNSVVVNGTGTLVLNGANITGANRTLTGGCKVTCINGGCFK